jgi:hypothetical protein
MAVGYQTGRSQLVNGVVGASVATIPDYHLHKLSSINIQIVQCSAATLCRLRKSWKKTEDVERLCKAGGWPRKIEEPLNAGAIDGFVAVLNRERDSLSTLETVSEARIARHGLPAGLMARMKGSVKTWRRAAT